MQENPAPLLANQRQDYIYDQVCRKGGVRVAELVEELNVSEVTIRRDITELVSRGLIERVYGGAVATETAPTTPVSFSPLGQEKIPMAYLNSLEQIAIRATEMVFPGQSLVISGGRTCALFAQQLVTLSDLSSLTVITNSLVVAHIINQAMRAQNIASSRLLLVGGQLQGSDLIVGGDAVEFLSSIQTDLAFVGAQGITAEAGFTVESSTEASVLRQVMQAGAKRVCLASRDKWGKRELRTFSSLENMDVWITDRVEAGSSLEKAAEDNDIELLAAVAYE